LPGFQEGTGVVCALEAGVQMRVAFEHYRNPPPSINLSMAQARQERVHYRGRWASNIHGRSNDRTQGKMALDERRKR
jgi:hypothetical protein